MHILNTATTLLCFSFGMLGAQFILAEGQGDILVLPFYESFEGTELDSKWTVDVSEGNSVAARHGSLQIRSFANTYAHIERRLRVDNCRASCAIKPGPAISWCTSLFFYWKPGDWCQMGVISRDGGRFYVTEMENGDYSEYDLSQCRFNDWHYVAIELGEDCIRFLSSSDGRVWKCERVAPRPERYTGPPELLIIGKGYSRGDKQYPAADLDNDYTSRGMMAISNIRELVVRPTEQDRLRARAKERYAWEMADRDALGEGELAADRDPSFESVARHLPAMKHVREVVGVKDHPHDVGVAEDGTLQLSDNPRAKSSPIAFFEVGAPPVRFGSGGARCVKRLLKGYLPVVIAKYERDGLNYQQTVLGYSKGMSPDAELFAYVRMKVSNPGDANRKADISFRVEPANDENEPKRWQFDLKPQSAPAIYLRVPFAVQDSGASEIDSREFDQRLDEVEDFWTKLLASGMKISAPEERVNDAYRAWLAYSFLDVDKRGEVYEPHDGAGFYEAVYGYSAALYCHALDLMGRHESSRLYIESLLHFQADDGLFSINFGLPDTGSLLFALSQHYRLTGDAAWLRSIAPKMIRMCDWVIERRKHSTKRSQDERPVTYGLIKFRPYCDHPQPAFDYFGDCYNCVGLEETARVFGEIGMASKAARIQKESAAYRRDILASMDAAVVERGGLKILPMEPDTHRILKGTRYRAGGYYGLVASIVLESEFLPAFDERARWISSFMERKGGLILGLCEFAKGVDHAYTYGYWLNCLRRDEVKRALLGFYATLAYGASRETHSGVEVTKILTGDNDLTLPHLYSCTQQLRLLRMMLLREEGDSLLIGYAIPRPWLEGGKRVEVKDAPTTFGAASFKIESHIKSGVINVRVEPPMRRPTESIKVRLRCPAGRNIASVKSDEGLECKFQGDVVEVSRPRRRFNLEVRCSGAP